MSEYDFSLASHGDIPEIHALYRSCIGAPGCTWDIDYPNDETAGSDIKLNSLYILKDGGRIIAAASAGPFYELGHLRWRIKNPCELARIGVVPDMRNKGVGTVILRNVIEEAGVRGYDGIRILVSVTNHPALRLYEKNGFELCGETFMFEMDFYCYQLVFGSGEEFVSSRGQLKD